MSLQPACHGNSGAGADTPRDLAARPAVWVVAIVMILLTACAETPTGKTDLLAFLQAPAVNRDEVYRHLGDPSAVF